MLIKCNSVCVCLRVGVGGGGVWCLFSLQEVKQHINKNVCMRGNEYLTNWQENNLHK